jgi:flagellar hook-associated protein 2
MGNITSSSNVTRTYGLSGSGIDVDTLVKQMMTAEKVPYTQLWQKQQVDLYKKDAYNTMNTSITNFKNNKVASFQLQSSLAPKAVTSSNTAVATITANADAPNVSHSLSVTQLASGIAETSSGALTITNGKKDTLANQVGLTGTAAFNINGKTVSIGSGQSINDLVSNINKAAAGVTATYDTNTDRLFLYSNSTGSTSGIDFTGTNAAGLTFLTQKLKLNAYTNIDANGITSTAATAVTNANAGVDASGNPDPINFPAPQNLQADFAGLTGTFNLKFFDGTTTSTVNVDTSTDSIQSVLTKINSIRNSSNQQIAQATFLNGKFTLKGMNGSTLDLSSSDSTAIGFLNNQLNMNISTQRKGQDAQFKLDGISMTQSTNQFTVASVKYNLLSTGSSNIGISTDVDKMVSNIETFVSDYNTQLSALYSKFNEKYDKTYQPLTDEQKTAMKDSDVSLWTTKAQTGLLHNDSILKTLAESMRNAVTNKVNGITGSYTSASSMGITEGDYTENGKLYVDETKLRAALQADPNAAYKLFGTTGTSDATNGVAVRINKLLQTASSSIVDQAGTSSSATSDYKSNLGIDVNDITKRLSDMNDKLNTKQSAYYTKFNAMESAMAKISQQSSWVTSMLGNS